MTDQAQHVTVTTTIESKDKAAELARAMVESKLAACTQYMPIKSVYRWKGNVESADEYLLISKTRKELADKLMAFIKDNHPYEVPELTVTPIIGGSADYLGWIGEETAR